ncbi:MAG: hypothetical protein AAGC70_19600 [Pseudomonadota bacterium]
MRQMMYGSVSSVITVLLLGGCASDGTNLLTTASTPKSEAKAIVDPKCVTLLSRIEALKKEGTVARVEKAADGKTRSVMVKRSALSKVAELNQAYGDYQANCSKAGLTQTAKATKPAAAQPTQAATANSTATTPATTASATPAKPATTNNAQASSAASSAALTAALKPKN